MMNDVMRIAVKDFQIQVKSIKNYVITTLFFVLLFTVGGLGRNTMLLPILALFVLYRFINYSMYEDEKNNTLRLLASLPLKRDTIVFARYLSTGVLIVVLSILLGSISALLPSGEAGSTALVLCIFFVYVIMISIYMPIGFKLGYIKAVNINRFIFLGLFVLLGAVPVLLGKGEGPQDGNALASVITMLDNADHVLIVAGFALVTLLLYIISMKISVIFFRKRTLF